MKERGRGLQPRENARAPIYDQGNRPPPKIPTKDTQYPWAWTGREEWHTRAYAYVGGYTCTRTHSHMRAPIRKRVSRRMEWERMWTDGRTQGSWADIWPRGPSPEGPRDKEDLPLFLGGPWVGLYRGLSLARTPPVYLVPAECSSPVEWSAGARNDPTGTVSMVPFAGINAPLRLAHTAPLSSEVAMRGCETSSLGLGPDREYTNASFRPMNTINYGRSTTSF